MKNCEWHEVSDNLPEAERYVPATTHCRKNRGYVEYDLCQECAEYLDSDQADWPEGEIEPGDADWEAE